MLILTKQGQKCGILSKIRKIEKHCKSLYINYFVAFSFLCLRRLCSGSGYELSSKVIAKPLMTRGLAIFLFLYFPTFSPHLQGFVQSEPHLPHQKNTNLGWMVDSLPEWRVYCRQSIKVFNRKSIELNIIFWQLELPN